MKPYYKRFLLKLSGEALMGEQSFGISDTVLKTTLISLSGVFLILLAFILASILLLPQRAAERAH